MVGVQADFQSAGAVGSALTSSLTSTTQAAESVDVLNIGGFSDHVFEVVAAFAEGGLGADHWVGVIEQV